MLASPGLQRNCSALTDLLLLDRHMEAAGGTRESQAALLMHPGGMRAAGVGGAVTRLEAATRGRVHRAALEARRLPGRRQRRSTCTVLRRLLSAASRCLLCALSSSGSLVIAAELAVVRGCVPGYVHPAADQSMQVDLQTCWPLCNQLPAPCVHVTCHVPLSCCFCTDMYHG